MDLETGLIRRHLTSRLSIYLPAWKITNISIGIETQIRKSWILEAFYIWKWWFGSLSFRTRLADPSFSCLASLLMWRWNEEFKFNLWVKIVSSMAALCVRIWVFQQGVEVNCFNWMGKGGFINLFLDFYFVWFGFFVCSRSLLFKDSGIFWTEILKV